MNFSSQGFYTFFISTNRNQFSAERKVFYSIQSFISAGGNYYCVQRRPDFKVKSHSCYWKAIIGLNQLLLLIAFLLEVETVTTPTSNNILKGRLILASGRCFFFPFCINQYFSVKRYYFQNQIFAGVRQRKENIRGEVLFQQICRLRAYIFPKERFPHECFPWNFPIISKKLIYRPTLKDSDFTLSKNFLLFMLFFL